MSNVQLVSCTLPPNWRELHRVICSANSTAATSSTSAKVSISSTVRSGEGRARAPPNADVDAGWREAEGVADVHRHRPWRRDEGRRSSFGVSFPIRTTNFDKKLVQDCRNFGFWRVSNSVFLASSLPVVFFYYWQPKFFSFFVWYGVELATILSMSWLLPPANLGFFSARLVSFSTVLAVFETLKMFKFWRDFDHLNMFI